MTVAASVTSDGQGRAQGAVQFRDGQKVLGQVALSNGVARFRLPARLAVGVHRITATFVPADPAVQGPSVSTAMTVRVVKAAASARSRLAKSSVTARQRAKVTVTVRAAGLPVLGRVSVKVTRKGSTRTVTGTVRNGKVTVRLPKLRRGTWTVSSRYLGSSTVAGTPAPKVRLRVR